MLPLNKRNLLNWCLRGLTLIDEHSELFQKRLILVQDSNREMNPLFCTELKYRMAQGTEPAHSESLISSSSSQCHVSWSFVSLYCTMIVHDQLDSWYQIDDAYAYKPCTHSNCIYLIMSWDFLEANWHHDKQTENKLSRIWLWQQWEECHISWMRTIPIKLTQNYSHQINKTGAHHHTLSDWKPWWDR